MDDKVELVFSRTQAIWMKMICRYFTEDHQAINYERLKRYFSPDPDDLSKVKFAESDVLSNAVNEQIFNVEKLKAIAERKSYAFETNFSASNPMETANEFRKAGYEIHLIFMGLNSIEESIQRLLNSRFVDRCA